MKKSVLVTILGIITIGCIIFGSFKNLNLKSNWHKGEHGHFDWSFNFDDDEDEEIIEKTDENANETSEKKGYFSSNLEAFSSIKVTGNVMGVNIEEGYSFRIEAKYSKESLKPSFSVRDGVLSITQQKLKGNNGNNNCKVSITVPAGTKFNSVDVKLNVGDFEIENFAGNSFKAKINVGEIDLHNCNFDLITCESNVGEIDINTGSDTSKYDIDLKTNIGEVKVNGKSYRKKYNARGKGNGSIKVVTNVGAIRVN